MKGDLTEISKELLAPVRLRGYVRPRKHQSEYATDLALVYNLRNLSPRYQES